MIAGSKATTPQMLESAHRTRGITKSVDFQLRLLNTKMMRVKIFYSLDN